MVAPIHAVHSPASTAGEAPSPSWARVSQAIACSRVSSTFRKLPGGSSTNSCQPQLAGGHGEFDMNKTLARRTGMMEILFISEGRRPGGCADGRLSGICALILGREGMRASVRYARWASEKSA